MLSSIFGNFMQYFVILIVVHHKVLLGNSIILGTSWNILEFKTIIIAGLNFELCHKEQS
jgi:hypothetical protein